MHLWLVTTFYTYPEHTPDTPSVAVVLFPVDTPDKTPYVLSEDFYQEKLLYKPLLGRFMRTIFHL